MAGRLSRFPGHGCRFHLRGRCLREELRNPGLRESFRCAELRRLEMAYDTFLDQSERFRLSEETALRVWRSRLTELLRQGSGCPDFVPEGDVAESFAQSGVMNCVHAHHALCLRALPVCEGVCRYYEAGRQYPGHEEPANEGV